MEYTEDLWRYTGDTQEIKFLFKGYSNEKQALAKESKENYKQFCARSEKNNKPKKFSLILTIVGIIVYNYLILASFGSHHLHPTSAWRTAEQTK